MVEVGSGRSTLGDLARASLEVRGPLWARRLADAATGLAVLSLAAGLWWGPVAVALVALVLLGVVAVRLADLPGTVQATGLVALLASAWAALLEGYQAIGWLDVVAHAVITGLLAAVATALLTGPPLRPARTAPGTRADAVLGTTAIGALLAVVWEVGEWVGHTYLDPAIHVGYDDTVGDLAVGVLGSLVAGVLVARARHRDRTP